MQTVHVDLSQRGYDIVAGTNLLGRSQEITAGWVAARHAVVITDENVAEPYARVVGESLGEGGLDVDLIEVPAGEPTKSAAMAEQLWSKLLELGADRSSLVVAVGGGVVGDLAGFVAASYARGIDFVQVPTTLLAQVDSSVGGKTGINLPEAKNMVGAFWQPRGVLIDVDSLATLPDREFRAGLAEVVKYGVILDAEFFTYLEQHADQLNARDADVLTHVVARCCRLKADVVQADERETSGLRAVLNYGHTFAHALEAVAGYGELLHGEAVSIGMECAARLAHALGRVDDEFVGRQHKLLSALGLPTVTPDLPRDKLMQAMQSDKKAKHGRIRFVLPTRLGHVELVENTPPEQAVAAWDGD